MSAGVTAAVVIPHHNGFSQHQQRQEGHWEIVRDSADEHGNQTADWGAETWAGKMEENEDVRCCHSRGGATAAAEIKTLGRAGTTGG